MKRLMTSGLISWLAANRNCLRADLFQITLANGQGITATNGQRAITVVSGTAGWVDASGASLPTTTFHSKTYGRWSRGPIVSEASFSLKSNPMKLTCVPSATTVYPGLNVPVLNAALGRLFDAATVQVWTAYMPLGQYGTVQGVETKFYGTINKCSKLTSTSVEFDCGDPFFLLGGNTKVPTRCFKPDCPWSFGDGNCGINLSGTDTNGYHITQAFTAANGSTAWQLLPVTSFSQPNGYFTQGIVTCTSGANAGLSQTVKLHASGALTLMAPWLIAPNPGDTFSVVAGCDRTFTTCQNKFNNKVNFGGTPYVPPQTRSI